MTLRLATSSWVPIFCLILATKITTHKSNITSKIQSYKEFRCEIPNENKFPRMKPAECLRALELELPPNRRIGAEISVVGTMTRDYVENNLQKSPPRRFC